MATFSNSGNVTWYLVEQNFAMARALGDDFCLVDDGRTIRSGPMAELIADQALLARHLGV